MREYTVIAINQEYDLIDSCSFDSEAEAMSYMHHRFKVEKEMMKINNEDIIEDDFSLDKESCRLFYEDKGEILGFVMYVINNTKEHA